MIISNPNSLLFLSIVCWLGSSLQLVFILFLASRAIIKTVPGMAELRAGHSRAKVLEELITYAQKYPGVAFMRKNKIVRSSPRWSAPAIMQK